MRAFVALDLPEAAVAALARVQARCPAGRAVPPENLHLTLAFLDDQPVAALEALHDGLEAIRQPGFALDLRGLEMFGGQVLALRAGATPELVRLHDAVRAAARGAGLTPERRRFRPHVTLARIRGGAHGAAQARMQAFLMEFGDLALPAVPFERFCLYGSTLRPEGAVHEVLAEYPLG